MELYRVGEAFIRSSQPLLPFLAPSICTRLPHRKAMEAVTRHCRNSPRTFTTSLQPRDDRPRAPRSRHDPDVDFDISSLLDGALDGNKGTPAAPTSRTSHFKSNTAQNNPPTTARSNIDQYEPPPGDSLADIFAALGKSNSRPTTRTGSSGRSTADYTNMLDPFSSRRNPTNPRNSPNNLPSINLDANAPLPIKLGPSVGRTVIVDQARGMDVGRAFRSLEVQCARNSVRKDFNRQRFHERPGLKRKRLRQERWRRRFRENFKGVIGLVQRMRAQGW